MAENNQIDAPVSAFGKTLIDDATAGDARTTLGLGTIATQNANAVAITGGTLTGITTLSVLDSVDQSHALSIVVGSDLTADRNFTLTTGDAARALDISAADVTVTTFGASLVDDATAGDARTTLGLGTMATQAASAVAITGGTIAGVGATTFTHTSGSLGTAVTGVTQAPGTNDTTIATTAYTDAAVAAGGAAEIISADSSHGTQLELYEDTDNGTNKAVLQGPDSLSADYTLKMPTSGPSGYQHLISTASGQLGYSVPSTSLSPEPNNSGTRLYITESSNGSLQSVYSNTFINPGAVYTVGNHYPAVGTSGIDASSAGLTMTNDTIYAFPVFVTGIVNRISFGVQTADASATADMNVSLFEPQFNVNSGTYSMRYLANRLVTAATESNISTTGIKTVTISSTTCYGGLVWVVLRPDNIGTSLVLAAPQTTQPHDIERLLGLDLSDLASPAYRWGLQYNSQTSVPSSLLTTTADAFITTACPVYVGVE